ncbi:MAG: class I SAM-dependent methyltransferase [Gammaproteobacteria bacterium]|nr:class I SAM-dependent methyltransferase [Gammaproteobacteria bacterium]MBU1415501.1 class I SAM-dependent methyltransferase [Gammaproteobacteria bacterium]
MAQDQPISPLRAALLAQILGGLVAVGLIALLAPHLLTQPLNVALLQGLCAAFTSYKLESPPWWHPIHLGFMPLVVIANELNLAPYWYLGAFVALLIVYWRVPQSRVPLYLSSNQAASEVASLLPDHGGRVMDLGCGNGTFLRNLARLRPDCSFVGVEYAPLPWLWARLTCAGLGNCRIDFGDYWLHSLADFDLVYAFLSPAPMSNLWDKAATEMGPDAWLVSNSFEVPDEKALQVLQVTDRRMTHLYCYRPGRKITPGSR